MSATICQCGHHKTMHVYSGNTLGKCRGVGVCACAAFTHYPSGTRVEIAPRYDLWMRGARFGTIRYLDKRGGYMVKMDHLRGMRRHCYRFPAEDLKIIG